MARKTRNQSPDYSEYHFDMKERILYLFIGMLLLFLFGYIFYESYLIPIMCSPMLIFFIKYIRKLLCRKRKDKLLLDFREFCISFSAQLAAGYSFENALAETIKELKKICGVKSDIIRELSVILEKIKLNIPIEKGMMDFAIRSQLDDIRLFSEVLGIGRRGGGDFISIVRTTTISISEKIEMDRDIQSMMSEKKFEQMIMNVIPLFMVIYIKLSSPELMNIMYDTLLGRVIMTGCLIVYFAALIMGKKIMDIRM